MLIIAFCVDTATVSALLLLADKQVSRIGQADLLFLKLMINNENGLGHMIVVTQVSQLRFTFKFAKQIFEFAGWFTVCVDCTC